MPLQSSGRISLVDVQGEFGGTAPHSLKEYYDATSGVPVSGEISLFDFYGKSSFTGPVTQLLTTSISNFTPPVTGWDSATVYVIGGGGGGGGSNDNDASAATGGTGGGTAIRHYTNIAGANVVIGSGGGVQPPSGGYNGDRKFGLNGGNSTFSPFSGSAVVDGGGNPTSVLTGGGGLGGSAEHGSRQGATAPARAGGTGSGGSTNYNGQGVGGVPGPNSTTVGGGGGSVSLTSQLSDYTYPNQGENTSAASHATTIVTKPDDFTNTSLTYYLNNSVSNQATIEASIAGLSNMRGGRGSGSERHQSPQDGSPKGAGGGAESWTSPHGYVGSRRPGEGGDGCIVIVYKSAG